MSEVEVPSGVIAWSFEELAQALADALHLTEESKWAAGDVLLALGDDHPPLRALASSVGRSASYLSSLRKVAKSFPPETRAQDVSWSHHELCARAEDPLGWLDRSLGEGWSVKDLRERLKEEGVIKSRGGGSSPCAEAEARLEEAKDLLRQYAWEQVGYAKRLRPVDVEDFLDREEADGGSR